MEAGGERLYGSCRREIRYNKGVSLEIRGGNRSPLCSLDAAHPALDAHVTYISPAPPSLDAAHPALDAHAIVAV